MRRLTTSALALALGALAPIAGAQMVDRDNFALPYPTPPSSEVLERHASDPGSRSFIDFRLINLHGLTYTEVHKLNRHHYSVDDELEDLTPRQKADFEQALYHAPVGAPLYFMHFGVEAVSEQERDQARENLEEAILEQSEQSAELLTEVLVDAAQREGVAPPRMGSDEPRERVHVFMFRYLPELNAESAIRIAESVSGFDGLSVVRWRRVFANTESGVNSAVNKLIERAREKRPDMELIVDRPDTQWPHWHTEPGFEDGADRVEILYPTEHPR